ncbi:MAG: bifunctional [glutamate--ammonia ligase]-adenylyl-L-tyrosine phosphorylase/[glutamate--ammonia-ligase] adenylyltransferase, partial [Gammaproteobacteria bacterium]|nr:bifunctional [glutamate--ammonia ligase]-adenylyl-L-tyrosine phosphorylase/[glutamate--ammonia-ligase] adenylyltransferase [Gammaproteobacteria bacterium]
QEMVRIAWRDIAGLAELEETTRDLSRFADVILDEALLLIHAWQAQNLGVPTNSAGQEQSLIVVAMGKLGAFELNFSSDIDLIFTIPESGKTVGGRRERTSEEFFIRLGQRLIHVLNTPTADGFVFRVDMRLRPFGSSGPLVVTFDAMESYYQNHGRDWERYAWVKARISAGNRKAGNLLLETMRPFVYRRYLDYGAFESLREMKTLVAREVAKKGMEGDVKLGPGGIREVEFITQTFQLIRGGREPKLRERQLLAVLGSLAEDGYLEESTVKELSLAYRFLRDVEHRIQESADQQSQSLPDTPEQRARVAYGMGHSDWDSFKGVLDRHRLNVQGHFNQVFSVSRKEQQEHILASIWAVSSDSNHAATVLADIGFAHPTEVLTKLDKLRNSYNIRRMHQQGRRRLDRLMPLLMEAVAKTKHREQTLERLVNLIEAVAHRSVYLALLAEHPGVLSQLVKLCTASPWIAKHITRYPLLLDELLDAHSLYAPPTRLDLEMELDQELEKLEKGDEEEELDALRLFKQTNILRVAAADVFGTLPLMQVSDHLTDIAEVLLCRTLEIAWQDITSRYGEPRYTLNGREQIAGFAIVAYGKLGGIELGYGSDLDIVFLHGSSGAGQMSNGKKSIDNQIFFSRLSRRLVHLLTTPTSAGTLYEVDFRLRPSGNSGMLVSSMDAFTEYQLHQAWTWEHQALVRARVVAGDPQLAGRFRKIRQDVLTQQCDQAELRKQVRKMRYRMREELRKSGPDQFDLKQDPGGIADIEFLVQYGVLSWTHQTPRISEYTDNIRILESFSTNNILSEGETSLLTDAYRAFRARTHVLALQEQPAVVDDREFRELRKGVTDIWDRLLEKP